MNFLNISFTHKNTDIGVREKLSFSSDEKKSEVLKLICSNQNVSECLLLSTCNRVEVLAFVNDLDAAQSYILKVMSISSGVALNELEKRADIHYGNGAIHHLFSVASSLDSLVVGETQIVGQLKDALKFALDNAYADINLKRAVESSFGCAAEVRTKTQISKNPVSVSSVAVAKAKDIFHSLEDVKVVVVGAGKMSELACRHLLSSGANVVLVNRSEARARELMREICSPKVEFEPFSKLKELINSHQLIFTATAASGVIINDALIDECDFDRYFFDIAVPRDIDITETSKVKVYSVDDLQEIVKANMALREEQAQIAYSIVGQDTNEFFKMLKILSTTPVIKALRHSAREVAEVEIEKAIQKGYLKNCDKEEARKLIHQVFKAYLHTPTINLKNLDDSDADMLNSVLHVFDIKDKFEEYSKDL